MAQKAQCAAGFPGTRGFHRIPDSCRFQRLPKLSEGSRGFPRFQGFKVSKFPKDPKLSEIFEIPNISNMLLDLQSAQGSHFLCLLRFPKFVGFTISQ